MEISSVETSYPLTQLIHNLPQLNSFEDFCFTFTKNHDKNNSLSSLELNLFYFGAYNQAIKKTSLQNKLKDFRLFIFINDFKAQTKRTVMNEQYGKVINVFISELTTVIKESSLINNTTDSTFLADVYSFVSQVEMKLSYQPINNTFKMIKEVINSLKIVLQDNTKNICGNRFYGKLINSLPISFSSGYLYSYDIDKSKDNQEMTFGDKDKGTMITFPVKVTRTYSYYNMLTKQEEQKVILSNNHNNNLKTLTKALSNHITLEISRQNNASLMKENVKFNLLSNQKNITGKIIRELYNNRLKNVILFRSQVHENSPFTLHLIGSYSYFYNTFPYPTMDFVIIFKYIHQKTISANTIIKSLHNRTINQITFSHPSFSNSPNQYSSNDNNNPSATNYLTFQCFYKQERYSARVYIQCEKYLKCSQIIEKIFSKGSTIAKVHLFIKPIFKYLTSIEIIFVILAFLNSKYQLFNLTLIQEELQYSYSNDNCMNFKITKETCSSYEISLKAMKKMSYASEEVLVMQLMRYYYGLYQSSLHKSIGNYVEINDSYIFCLKTIDNIWTQLDEDYWKKIDGIRDLFQKNYFNSYEEILKHFKIII